MSFLKKLMMEGAEDIAKWWSLCLIYPKFWV